MLLDFFQKTMDKLHVRVCVLRAGATPAGWHALGLAYLVQANERYLPTLAEQFSTAQEAVVYRTTDVFGASILYWRMPSAVHAELVVVGPFLREPYTRERLYARIEELHLPAGHVAAAEAYYSSLPYFRENSAFYVMVDTLAEQQFGDATAFSFVDVQAQDVDGDMPPHAPLADADPMTVMRVMEERYAFEEQLMDAVRQGLPHKAERLFARFSPMGFERRLSDPLRNSKNYAIITNTLLRKAAQQGGVHPVHLDRLSSGYACRIEQISSVEGLQALMAEMFRGYCRLVRKHTTKGYSQPVQKALICIDSDLSADLSLHTLAAMLGLNASYLSALFRRETGKTITAYISEKRVDLARHLLKTTAWQVQTVAQHCGFADVGYFTKTFKKLTGETPRQMRERRRQEETG